MKQVGKHAKMVEENAHFCTSGYPEASGEGCWKVSALSLPAQEPDGLSSNAGKITY